LFSTSLLWGFVVAAALLRRVFAHTHCYTQTIMPLNLRSMYHSN
jgi:hypothetical protein